MRCTHVCVDIMVLSVVNNLRRHLRHDSYPCSACAVFVVNFDFLVLFMGMPADTYLCKRVNISVVLLPLAFRTRITSPFPLPMHRTISDSLVEFQPSGIIQDKSPFYLDGFFSSSGMFFSGSSITPWPIQTARLRKCIFRVENYHARILLFNSNRIEIRSRAVNGRIFMYDTCLRFG